MEQTEDQTNVGSRVLRDLDHSDEITDLPELEGGDYDGGYGSPVEISDRSASVTDGQPLVERRSQPWLETGNADGDTSTEVESTVVSEADNRLDPGSPGDAWPSLTNTEDVVDSVDQLEGAATLPGDIAVDDLPVDDASVGDVVVGDVAVADVTNDVAARESAEVDLLDRPTLDTDDPGALDLELGPNTEVDETGVTTAPSPDSSDDSSESPRRSCRICSSPVSQINIKVDGNTLILESCDQCDARRWRLDGQPIDLQQALDEVGEHAGRRQ